MSDTHECLEVGAKVWVVPANPEVAYIFAAEVLHVDALGISVFVPKQADRPRSEESREFWPWSSICKLCERIDE